MARNYNDRKLRWVKPSQQTGTLKYGFQSALASSRASLFGQADVAVTDLQGLVIGANNPKPAKATKKLATGYESSFCDFSKWADLEQQGYNVVAPKKTIRLPRTTSLSTTMYVTINGVKYAWQMPLVVGTVGNLTAVGAKSAAAGATDLVFGASFPKPPRYQYVNTATGDRLNIFGDPSTDEATANTAGWVQTFSGRYSQQDLALLIG